MINFYHELHELFNSLERFKYPFDNQLNKIPENGMYIMFEKGEHYENMDRIVSVGIHKGMNKLKNRINEHFIRENKDRSIFRKNIGRCFLNAENKDYLTIWNKDSTAKKDRLENSDIKDFEYEKQLESRISKYIQQNISFAVIEMNNVNDRVFWVKKIIATLAQFDDITVSDKWLGNISTKYKIRQYGLWQVNNLMGDKITEYEYDRLIKMMNILKPENENKFTLKTKKMIVVISCSGSKNGKNLIYNGKEINFVSMPEAGNKNQFRPDDKIPSEQKTWREYVNNQQENEKILESYNLYKPAIYKALHEKFNTNLFILSAGWGIINSEFRIPKYDITFSKRADISSQRGKYDSFTDFNHLQEINPNEKIVFFGGSDYIKLFYELTRDLPNEKIIFYKKKNIYRENPFLKSDKSYKLIKYETKASTNWHYGCAKEFINGNISI